MTASTITGYELLCALAERYGWKVRLETNGRRAVSSGKVTILDPSRLTALEVRYRLPGDVRTSLPGARVARRALGPGDDRLDTAAWELLDALRALNVLVLKRRP